MISRLPDLSPEPPPPEGAGPDHPMRRVTREIAFETDRWTPERAKKVTALFDGLAPDWHERHAPERVAPLADALARGDISARSCVELGAGTGAGTAILARRFERVTAFDLSREMLSRLASNLGSRCRADAQSLPLRTATVEVLVLMNMLLFPKEAARVLAPGGTLVWVNSLGEQTPIHLSPEEVARALPGQWSGKTARAGLGLWCVLQRVAAQAGPPGA